MESIKTSLSIILPTIFIVCLSQLCVAANHINNTCIQRITLAIFSHNHFYITNFKDRPPVRALLASLTGLHFEKNSLQLVSSKTGDVEYGGFSVDDMKFDSPDSIGTALKMGKTQWYPLHWHKLAKNIENGALQIVCARDEQIKTINLGSLIEKRILEYLTFDAQDTDRQCYDFILHVCLKDRIIDYHGINITNLKDGIEIFESEDSVLAKDAIVLLAEDVKGLKIMHYALALGETIYISKFGNGRFLLVTDMQAMLDFWKCTRFARIIPGAEHFLVNLKNQFCYVSDY
jgi:hypothetical protein